jgi:molybdopterin synthase sulfur carrier subunit
VKINLFLFGQLADIAGSGHLVMDEVPDTDSLNDQLQQLYPALSLSTYIIAVNKDIINANTLLKNEDTVALLPPYAGG